MELNFTAVAMLLAIGLVLLIFGLALIPVRLRVFLCSDAKRLTIKFWKLTIVDSDRSRRASVKKSQKTQKTQKAKKTLDKLSGFAVRRSSRFWPEIVRRLVQYVVIAPKLATALLGFIARLVRKVNMRDIRGSVAGGLADPADTGMACGALYAIFGAAPVLQSRLQVKPDYLAESITYDLRGEVSIRPFALVWPSVRLMHDLPKRELLRIIWSRRKGRRRQEVKSATSKSG